MKDAEGKIFRGPEIYAHFSHTGERTGSQNLVEISSGKLWVSGNTSSAIPTVGSRWIRNIGSGMFGNEFHIPSYGIPIVSGNCSLELSKSFIERRRYSIISLRNNWQLLHVLEMFCLNSESQKKIVFKSYLFGHEWSILFSKGFL